MTSETSKKSDVETFDSFCNWMNQSLVHYSNKIVNSSVPAGGVRLGADQALNLPHICGRTMLWERLKNPETVRRLELDYCSVSPRFKFLRAWLGEEVSGLSGKITLSETDQHNVAQHYRNIADGESPASLQSENISIRLKQLLLPKNGDFVSVTPLPSLSIGTAFKTEFREREDAFFKNIKIRDAKKSTNSEKETAKYLLSHYCRVPVLSNYSVGGANPQNVGGRVHEAYTRPIVFPYLPKIEPEVRRAFSVAFRGIPLRLPRKLIEEYNQFLQEVRRDAGEKPVIWTVRLRDEEVRHLNALLGAWNRQAASARRLIEDNREKLPAILPVLEAKGGDQMEAWLYPESRTHPWWHAVAKKLSRELARFVLDRDQSGQPVTLGLAREDVERIRAAVVAGGVQ